MTKYKEELKRCVKQFMESPIAYAYAFLDTFDGVMEIMRDYGDLDEKVYEMMMIIYNDLNPEYAKGIMQDVYKHMIEEYKAEGKKVLKVEQYNDGEYVDCAYMLDDADNYIKERIEFMVPDLPGVDIEFKVSEQ